MLVMLSREKYILNKGFCQLNIISISTKAYLEKSQSNRSHCTFKKFLKSVNSLRERTDTRNLTNLPVK